MAVLTIPNNFSPGTTILSSLVDANFTAITNWSTTIDNSNIGAAGIFASQIIPTSAPQGIFGSNFGYQFSPAAAAVTPLTVQSIAAASANTLIVNMGTTQSVAGLLINGAASITGNLLEVDLTSGGTKAFSVNSAGAVNAGPGNATLFGDIGAARTTSTGQLALGGSVSNATLDYGITTATTLTVNRAFTAAGNVASQGGGILCYPTSLSAISSAAGDGVFQRGTATGGIWLGGAGTVGLFDQGLVNTGAFSFTNGSGGYRQCFGTSFTNSSDASLKTNVAPIANGTATALQLKPVSFSWIHDDAPGLGFLAQDVQAVLPDLVSTDVNGLMGVNYTGIIPVLVQAFQEMQAALHAAGVAGF